MFSARSRIAPGIEPVFPEEHQAIKLRGRSGVLRSGEIRIFDSSGNVERSIPFSEADRKLWRRDSRFRWSWRRDQTHERKSEFKEF